MISEKGICQFFAWLSALGNFYMSDYMINQYKDGNLWYAAGALFACFLLFLTFMSFTERIYQEGFEEGLEYDNNISKIYSELKEDILEAWDNWIGKK